MLQSAQEGGVVAPLVWSASECFGALGAPGAAARFAEYMLYHTTIIHVLYTRVDIFNLKNPLKTELEVLGVAF